jgi:superfamily II DNA or RNA helicase
MVTEIKPHDYQRDGLNNIYTKFKTKNRLMYQLSTGGGKTYVFSFLSRWWIKTHEKKVLILCHRKELIEQTIESMNRIGVTCEPVTAKTKALKHTSDCYVAMVETAYNRLKVNSNFFSNIGLLVADEAHIQVFDKVFHYFPGIKILGCSATPVVLKRIKFWRCKYCRTKYPQEVECCDEVTQEWSRPFTMSEIYDDIVLGPSIDLLIQRGVLVREVSFVKQYTDNNILETDADGEFTIQSMDQAYGTDNAVFNVLLNYEELCKGKKTMIFNSSAKTNLILYEKFKEAGHNVRMFDSVNKQQSGNREELIKWFREEPDAILMNVGVFTTGFDVREVEAIIINRPTNSLSLFIQIAGRGARSTDRIYKDRFILVDGGGNIDRHQEFSDPTRDWQRIFFKGLGKEKAKKEDAFDIQTCPKCGTIYAKSEQECPECGFAMLGIKPSATKNLSNKVLQPIRPIPPPNGEKIYEYTVKQGGDLNFAWKILISQIVDMFKFYRVQKGLYEKTLANGKLEKKVKTLIRKPYFVLYGKEDIKSSNNRTMNYLYNKVLDKLSELYGRN